MNKNIVICCDGTSNQFGDRNTNVVKLFSVLPHTPAQQPAFYDPGVGTFSPHPVVTKPAHLLMKGLGLAFGFGLTANIADAYRFLMQNYQPGDKVYLFGFSRGAYTVRAVAAMLHKCGLLLPHNENLLPYAINMYKHERQTSITSSFKNTFCRPCPVHFMGLWDTVTSVGWVWDPVRLPFTTNNPSVATIRHAVSIDERRGFYRQNLMQSANATQDVQHVWFAGVHSDIGGSYPTDSNGLSKITLEWMLIEAHQCGLLIDAPKALAATRYTNALDAPEHIVHTSLKHAWWLLELWPKLTYNYRTGRKRPYINLGRRRYIPKGSAIHASVEKRSEDVSNYNPPNLPQQSTQAPWQHLEDFLN